jgi:hypothetical protein
MMSVAVAFQMKGLGSRFQCCARVVIASDSSATFLQPELMALWAGVRTSRPECTVVLSGRGSDRSARVAEVVEYQGARIPAEWLLQLGGVGRSRAGLGDYLGIAGVLIHG